MRILPRLGMFVASIALVSSSAMAQVAGPWHVTGDVNGKAFAVDCRFAPDGAQFGGVCVDAATGDAKVKAGNAHKLTQGTLTGNQVRWTYQTSVLFMSVDIAFAGTLEGDRMTGAITAAGRKGAFTAVRK